jgi:hypothetical protein
MTFDNLDLSIILDEIEQEKKNGVVYEINTFLLMFFTLLLLFITILIGKF